MTPGIQAVAQARSGREALDLVAAAEPDLVMLDVLMAGLDGIETARRLHADYPAMIVLLVSSDLDTVEPLARSCGATALSRKQDLRPGCCAGSGPRTGPAHSHPHTQNADEPSPRPARRWIRP